jgi:hypothetical protein
MTGINGVHLLLASLLQNARSQLQPLDTVSDTRQAKPISDETRSLAERVNRIEQLLARSAMPKTGGNSAQDGMVTADWPVNSQSRDKINLQQRQQIVGDWVSSTAAAHGEDAFHHRVDTGATSQISGVPPQVVIERFVSTDDDLHHAEPSVNFGASSPALAALLSSRQAAAQDPDNGTGSRFLLIAVGLLLVFVLFL